MAEDSSKAAAHKDERVDVDWRSYVEQYPNNQEFPFELNEQVWVLKPGFRAPLGPFRISRVLPDDLFKLKEESTGIIYNEDVHASFLRRNPFVSNTT